ncbi:MAG: isochorismatase family protein [Firmicutes bacterium]|nr:isochorismatase family protein [Bacillota bacterium]
MKQALLVIDIQEALCLSQDESVSQTIASINDLISTYPKEHVYYIRHLEIGSEFDPNEPTSQFHHALTLVNNQVIIKYHHSAFYETSLHEILQHQNIDTIDICGYQIEYCVDATIKTGHFLGYKVRIHLDHIHTFNSSTLSKQDIKHHYVNQFTLYGDII